MREVFYHVIVAAATLYVWSALLDLLYYLA